MRNLRSSKMKTRLSSKIPEIVILQTTRRKGSSGKRGRDRPRKVAISERATRGSLKTTEEREEAESEEEDELSNDGSKDGLRVAEDGGESDKDQEGDIVHEDGGSTDDGGCHADTERDHDDDETHQDTHGDEPEVQLSPRHSNGMKRTAVHESGQTNAVERTIHHNAKTLSSPNASEDDFEESANLEEQKRMNYNRSHPECLKPTTEELDDEEDLELEGEVVPEDDLGERQLEVSTNEGQSNSKDLSDDAESSAENIYYEDMHPMDDDDTDTLHQRGPLSSEAQDEIDHLGQYIRDEVHKISMKTGKSDDSIYRLLGIGIKQLRMVNLFNVYSIYYAHHHAKPNDVSKEDWARQILQSYNERFEHLSAEERKDMNLKRKILKDIVAWYEEATKQNNAELKRRGKTGNAMARYAVSLNNISMQAYNNHGLHISGSIIHAGPDIKAKAKNCLWGASPNYIEYRRTQESRLHKEMFDMETRYRVMDLRAEGESVDVEGDHVVMFARRMKENSRDYHRRLIAELARSNIVKVAKMYGKIDHNKCKEFKMSWVDWADRSYEFEERIVDWPAGVKPPGKSFNFKKDLNDDIFKKIIGPMKLLYENQLPDGEECLRFESWSEDEKKLSLQDKKNIPIVIDTNGNELCYLDESKKYLKAVSDEQKAQHRKEPRSGTDQRENAFQKRHFQKTTIVKTQRLPSQVRSRKSKEYISDSDIEDMQAPRKSKHQPDASNYGRQQQHLADPGDETGHDASEALASDNEGLRSSEEDYHTVVNRKRLRVQTGSSQRTQGHQVWDSRTMGHLGRQQKADNVGYSRDHMDALPRDRIPNQHRMNRYIEDYAEDEGRSLKRKRGNEYAERPAIRHRPRPVQISGDSDHEDDCSDATVDYKGKGKKKTHIKSYLLD